ncbi:hypothetical protein M427DRAFT_160122 [Gonapodya prolifera JEL478]|uniref:Uncharacterized protein n=1 Tax=Gonapodya prolifera (strain JEL478) TaxID=1344416 RepID=A0A138ZZF0_GONPJ|nr:hypothetical protein M427DRAFT_160122 [Gonapodya prolifera JEL478]|eukprot:KXS09871.1 hypothetical protein M427DRAFT_160122 [Gonapodya prolifera JEL478]
MDAEKVELLKAGAPPNVWSSFGKVPRFRDLARSLIGIASTIAGTFASIPQLISRGIQRRPRYQRWLLSLLCTIALVMGGQRLLVDPTSETDFGTFSLTRPLWKSTKDGLNGISVYDLVVSEVAGCWGNPLIVGSCPFDYTYDSIPHELFLPAGRTSSGRRKVVAPPGYQPPEPWGRPPRAIRILYFTSWSDYVSRHDRFFYHEVYEAARHPGLTVFMWGPGFPGYDPNYSIKDNMMRLPGVDTSRPIDILYTSTWGLYEHLPNDTIQVHGFGDCHGEWNQDPSCVEQTATYAPNADVVAGRYAMELVDLFRPSKLAKIGVKEAKLWIHQPDCADPAMLYPLPWSTRRTHQVQVFGNTYYDFYPVRSKIAIAIERGWIKGEIFRHQGYAMSTAHNSSLLDLPYGTVDPSDPLLSLVNDLYSAYTQAMRSTQICVFDSSVIRKAIRKFHEAMLSGCVVASDVPHEMQNEVFRGVIIQLDAEWSVERIQEEFDWYLERPKLLRSMAAEAFKRARAELTCTRKVDRLLQSAARARRGDVGYWFPYGLVAGCRRYGGYGSPRSEVCANLRLPEVADMREKKLREEIEKKLQSELSKVLETENGLGNETVSERKVA